MGFSTPSSFLPKIDKYPVTRDKVLVYHTNVTAGISLTCSNPWHVIGGVSTTSKMPGYSYSIPRKFCRTGGVLARHSGSVCEKCYAAKGNYLFDVVISAQTRRYTRIMRALAEKDFRALYVAAFTEVLQRAVLNGIDPYFRFHDCGDLQSLQHLKLIREIAQQNPDILFWLPTRELFPFVARNMATEKNLVMRYSLPFVDKFSNAGNATNISAVTNLESRATCRAFENGGECGKCRKCWDASVYCVTYATH